MNAAIPVASVSFKHLPHGPTPEVHVEVVEACVMTEDRVLSRNIEQVVEGTPARSGR